MTESRGTVMFTIRGLFGDESFNIQYHGVDEALGDIGLQRLMEGGATCAVWKGTLRVTRDLTSWEKLRDQLVSNSATLLRGTC